MMRLWESIKWIRGKLKGFEEGIEPEFQDVEEELPKVPGDRLESGHVSGTSHGGYGSSSLQECLDETRPEAIPMLPAILG